MQSEELKRYIRDNPELYLKPDRHGSGYICPICGNGSHKTNSRGLVSKDGIHFTCFSGDCFTHADIIDIIALERGRAEASFPEKLRIAAEAIGIGEDNDLPAAASQRKPLTAQPEKHADYTNFLLQGQGFLRNCEPDEAVAYLNGRGIRVSTAIEAGVGYSAAWTPPNMVPGTVPPSPRLIFPTSNCSYSTRDIRPDDEISESARAYVKQKIGSAKGFFNAKALDSTEPVFVVEGEFDALSVLEAGGSAVSLGSTSNVKFFAEMMKGRLLDGENVPTLILSLDNDKAGNAAVKVLIEILEKYSIPFTVSNISGDYKDPNEALQRDRASFFTAIEHAVARARENEVLMGEPGEAVPLPIDTDIQPEEPKPLFFEDAFYNDFKATIERGFDPISTGLDVLDDLLGGGLYPELYVLGSSTGAGKTTLLTQIADYTARKRKGYEPVPVLYVTLEMSKAELKCKSVARLAQEIYTTGEYSASDLRNDKQLLYDRDHTPLTWEAFEMYQNEIAPNMMILEGVGNVRVDKIKELAKQIRDVRRRAPLVIVDYLQLLQPQETYMSERQAVDFNIMALKQMSRDLQTPVFLISSLNRESTKQERAPENSNSGEVPFHNESFKESGNIEMSASYTLLMTTRQDKAVRDEESETYTVKLVMRKGRHSAKRDHGVTLVFDGSCCLFVNK